MNDQSTFLSDLDKLASQTKRLTRKELIGLAQKNGEVFISQNGALVQWTPVASTGRSPQDTYIVDHSEIHDSIDWTSPNNIPISIDLSDNLFRTALQYLKDSEQCYITNRVIGADSHYALPVITYTNSAVSAIFTENMFRPTPPDINRSVYSHSPFHLVVLPRLSLPDQLKPTRKDGKKSQLVIFMDFHRKIGLIWGSSYLGSIKKLMFTVMNFLLPEQDILPLHASANEGANGDLALFLGLSGTGKTTLSADPERALLGDDEHGWSDHGISNFENGCYAKLINLDKIKEPEIFHAITHDDTPEKQGAIVENTMMYPDGTFDFNDVRLTENSRGSYPLTSLKNIKISSTGGVPSIIVFLTADANGVLPPVAKLSKHQAMFWFLMGYTSKLAGTEAGVKDPVSTFSRFFGAPFMPRNPQDYSTLLGKKLEKHNTQVFLVNTGWSGGPYGEGSRMSLSITRTIIKEILNGAANSLVYHEDKRFHVMVPDSFPGIDSQILDPSKTWTDFTSYQNRANRLAMEFSQTFQKNYETKNISQEIKSCCPGPTHT